VAFGLLAGLALANAAAAMVLLVRLMAGAPDTESPR
jgi:hypothetical protein